MLKIKAKVYFYGIEKKGLDKDGYSGMMASFSVNSELIMCKILYKDINTVIKRGIEYTVDIELPYGEMFIDIIKTNYRFNIAYASMVVGEGIVI